MAYMRQSRRFLPFWAPHLTASNSKKAVRSAVLYSAHVEPRVHSGYRKNITFTVTLLFMSLALQRFGFPLGSQQVSIVGPLGCALVVYGLLDRTLCFHKDRLINFLILVALVLVGALWNAGGPNKFAAGEASVASALQFLMLTSVATVTFVEP